MSKSVKIIATNRKARHLYNILETIETGIVLKGSEVKSLRQGKASFTDSFAKVSENEMWLYNLNIPPYDKASYLNHEPLRKKKLLLNGREIRKINSNIKEKGLTFVPLKIYFNHRGYVKIEMALAKGKTLYDKRETIAKRDAQRRIEKGMRDE